MISDQHLFAARRMCAVSALLLLLGCNDQRLGGSDFGDSLVDIGGEDASVYTRDPETGVTHTDIDLGADDTAPPMDGADGEDTAQTDADAEEDPTADADAGPCERVYACRNSREDDWQTSPIRVEVFGTSMATDCVIVHESGAPEYFDILDWERSVDGGQTWTAVLSSPVLRLGGDTATFGREQLFRAQGQTCPPEPLAVEFLPPGSTSESIGFSLTWTTSDAAPESDLDLMILRHPEECWTDERHRALASGNLWGRLNWGRATLGDEPVQTSRDVQGDGVEWILASGRQPSEAWTVAGRVYEIPEGGRVQATFEIVEGGEAVISHSRVFTETGWWELATGTPDGWQLNDTFIPGSTTLPLCDIADRCPDGAGEHEICDGVDNDCDGVIDENPDACYNERNGRSNCDRAEFDGGGEFYVCRARSADDDDADEAAP